MTSRGDPKGKQRRGPAMVTNRGDPKKARRAVESKETYKKQIDHRKEGKP